MGPVTFTVVEQRAVPSVSNTDADYLPGVCDLRRRGGHLAREAKNSEHRRAGRAQGGGWGAAAPLRGAQENRAVQGLGLQAENVPHGGKGGAHWMGWSRGFLWETR